MGARRYWIFLLVFNSISHSLASLTREISSRKLEEQFNISARKCGILYQTTLMMIRVYHRKKIMKLIFRALALRQSEFNVDAATKQWSDWLNQEK